MGIFNLPNYNRSFECPLGCLLDVVGSHCSPVLEVPQGLRFGCGLPPDGVALAPAGHGFDVVGSEEAECVGAENKYNFIYKVLFIILFNIYTIVIFIYYFNINL